MLFAHPSIRALAGNAGACCGGSETPSRNFCGRPETARVGRPVPSRNRHLKGSMVMGGTRLKTLARVRSAQVQTPPRAWGVVRRLRRDARPKNRHHRPRSGVEARRRGLDHALLARQAWKKPKLPSCGAKASQRLCPRAEKSGAHKSCSIGRCASNTSTRR